MSSTKPSSTSSRENLPGKTLLRRIRNPAAASIVLWISRADRKNRIRSVLGCRKVIMISKTDTTNQFL